MSRDVFFLVDGKRYHGYESVASAIGSTTKTIQNYTWTREKANGKGCVFTLHGHNIQRVIDLEEITSPVEKEPFAKSPSPAIASRLSPSELIAEELRGIKEQLRYTRECLLGGIHRVDEIAENLRAIERQIIEEKRVKGSYHGGIGNVSEHLG